jgi:tight adherence protein C
MLYPMIFGLLVSTTVILLILSFRRQGSRVGKRLIVEGKAEQLLAAPEAATLVLPSEMVEKFENKLGLKKGAPRVKDLKNSLIRAGIYHDRAVPIFMGFKLGLPLALPILALPWLSGRSLSPALLMGVLCGLCLFGYLLPNLVLNRLVKARQKKIREALPDALDLLVVCMQAGQGLDAAMKRVADDFMVSNPTLAKELLLVNLEINAGLERNQALRHLGERTGVDELASLCSVLIQSDRFGTSIVQTLKVQSETLRTTRRLKLEELAAKTPVKLIFPLLFCIFPAIMVVIIGPAVIRIAEGLLK